MNKAIHTPRPYLPALPWDRIDTVMLDMDGTLLDKYFDDYFWEKYVPRVYAVKHGLSDAKAEEQLLAKYRSVESTLQWTDLYYWTERLGLDMISLKREINELINVHDHVFDFFTFVKARKKRLCLITNAHPKTLDIKLEKTGIGSYFDSIICADEVGYAKEQVEFWHGLEKLLDFDTTTTMFADDTEKVLHAAGQYGLQYLVHVAKASSRLDTVYSAVYPSILHFKELIVAR
jgi:putative hydrolase of the HAD superfamily